MRSLLFIIVVVLPSLALAQETPDEPHVQNEKLRRELRTMFANDQRARTAWLKAMGDAGLSFDSPTSNRNPQLDSIVAREQSKMSLQDAANRKRLKEIIKRHGWPGKTLVGTDGANAAWLLVQHADADVAFQKECLGLMEAAPAGEVSQKDVAYLIDRVLVNEGKKQRYGTQMGKNFEPRTIEDPANVDKRRAQVGLPPLAEYVKTAKEQYNKWLTEKRAE